MENSSQKFDYDSGLENSASSSFRLLVLVACFMFLSFRLVTSLTGVACANSTSDNEKKSYQNSKITPIDPNNVNVLELLRAEISVAKNQKDTKSKNQLKKMIDQIRSVEFELKKPVPEPVIIPEKAPVIEPNEAVVEVFEQKETTEQNIKTRSPHKPITEETLQTLRSLAQDSQKITNPLELGEILFVSGNLKEAATFYSEALKRQDPNDTDITGERAWILFQIGNCLRNDDMPEAAKIYRQLLTEYPNSPWAGLATVRSNLIAWYMKEQPIELIDQAKSAGSEQDDIK